MPATFSYANSSKINKLLRLIKMGAKPSKFFWMDNESSFIMDGKMLPLKTPECSKLSNHDEFYIHIDTVCRKVEYYAFNLLNFTTGTKSDKVEGMLKWEDIEVSLLTFLIVNIYELTNAMLAKSPKRQEIKSNDNDYYSNGWPSTYHPSNTHTKNYTYEDTGWKERQDISDKFGALMKQNKTGQAIDYISGAIKKLCDDKNFSSLNTLMNTITIDTMVMPGLMAILKETRGADHILSNRKNLFEKTRVRLAKAKKTKILEALDLMSPGKEYPGVVKLTEKVEEPKETNNAIN